MIAKTRRRLIHVSIRYSSIRLKIFTANIFAKSQLHVSMSFNEDLDKIYVGETEYNFETLKLQNERTVGIRFEFCLETELIFCNFHFQRFQKLFIFSADRFPTKIVGVILCFNVEKKKDFYYQSSRNLSFSNFKTKPKWKRLKTLR